MKTETVIPNVKNFIKSLRDVGYSFEIAVADIIDNSITAKAKNIKIYTVAEPDIIFSMLDDGVGMSESELIEAMRLASKDPDDVREKNDLGRFGLGLKTASFSQCKKLTVVSKKNGKISAREWDLDYISLKNEWLLITPDAIESLPFYKEFKKQEKGTLVVWRSMDRYKRFNYADIIDKLRQHLALIFHRYLDGADGFRLLKIELNNNPIKAFNPFNISHSATQAITPEKIKLYGSEITVQPFILPHHSKISQDEYEKYATEDGYTRSQGFYLYRANRLLIHGTWWGLHRTVDAHNLVRIKIDIPNSQDRYWGIDIKKSSASPTTEIKNDLKRIIRQVTIKGSRPYTGRGRSIEDKTIKRFWSIIPTGNDLRFAINQEHPIYEKLISDMPDEQLRVMDMYLKCLQAYLPLEAIQAKLHESPHKIDQESVLSDKEIAAFVANINAAELDPDFIERLASTELFKNRKGLLQHGDK